jgi:hypothetical protein
MSWSTGTNLIEEGGMPKALTLQMLEVEKQGGGTEYFVRKSDTKLTTKSISKNGTYNASSDDAYGYSKVTVNVAGGNGSADSHGRPTTSGGINPGGPGSAVIGKDPETGNDVVVGVDEDGSIVKTPVPSGIKILKAPDKTDYEYQETIDYSGIVVHMKKKDGTDFTDSDHPTGLLLLNELIFPVEKAPAASGESSATSELDTRLPQPIPFHDTDATYEIPMRIDGRGELTVSGNTKYVIIRQIDGRETLFVASEECGGSVKSQHSHIYEGKRVSFTNTFIANNAFTYNGKTVYYSENVGNSVYCLAGSTTLPVDVDITPNSFWGDGPTAWTIIYGSISGGTATIPVQWVNPYTGETHQDTFQITSTPSSGSSSTTTGSSGTEGSGGGGTF